MELITLQSDKQTLTIVCVNCGDIREFRCKSKAEAARFIKQYKNSGRGDYCYKPECRAASLAKSIEIVNSIVFVDALTGEKV